VTNEALEEFFRDPALKEAYKKLEPVIKQEMKERY
jgi:hypothetical protein